MEHNILDAITNLIENTHLDLKEYATSTNRMNLMGAALEEYVKDLFAGTVNIDDEEQRLIKHSETFSYLGNQNNPPDVMIRNGDAIEVKKIEGLRVSLALNSSYPKHKLYSDSPMISEDCRTSEDWDVKDIIYAIGTVPKDNKIRQLTFIYGEDYAANEDIYTRIKDSIKDGVNIIPDIEFAETSELGRVNRVDPLGITYLRIRGMWGIENPLRVFDYVYTRDVDKNFNFMAIINNKKYNSFHNKDSFEQMINMQNNASITDIRIKNPNNPAQLKAAKLIKYSI